MEGVPERYVTLLTDLLNGTCSSVRIGVYTYPISFAIPANAPPTLSVDYGSVTWKLKAVVHRPGAFKTKLTASQDITVVALHNDCPLRDRLIVDLHPTEWRVLAHVAIKISINVRLVNFERVR